MNTEAQLMLAIGEPFAAGFLELENASIERIFCRAYRRYYESCPLFYEDGKTLFPTGCTTPHEWAVRPQYMSQYEVDWEMLEAKSPQAAAVFRSFAQKYNYGAGWHHAILHYRRILSEGVERYEQRVQALPPSDFREALLDVLCGIHTYHSRAVQYLAQVHAPAKLLDALQIVPFHPATTAYEAMVCLNFMLSLDGWDNMGRIDALLAPYHQGEDLRPELRRMMQSIQDNGMWSMTIGPEYNDITRQVLEASSGLSRPSIQLRVLPDMPQDLWDLAMRRVKEGGCQPAFLNEPFIQARLRDRFPNISPEEVFEFVCCGCSETHFAGLCFSGATDGKLHTLKVFEETMLQDLPRCADFETFYSCFIQRMHTAQDELMASINHAYNLRAQRCFAPIRTLFMDDCIDNQKGFFQGGARYTYGCPVDAGMPNTIDSLLAVKHLVYDTRRLTAEDFIQALQERSPAFLQLLKTCPCYGVGDDQADALAHDVTKAFYAHYRLGRLDMGLGFLPSSQQYNRYVRLGKQVGPTPDGRAASAPLADSIAAVNGKASKGPTMMLLSASRYAQDEVYSIPVCNLSIGSRYSPEVLRALIEGYFAMGGTQLQITCASAERMLAAKADPDSHRDLIVRVGGFSEFFCNLTPELQDAVIARTRFEA